MVINWLKANNIKDFNDIFISFSKCNLVIGSYDKALDFFDIFAWILNPNYSSDSVTSKERLKKIKCGDELTVYGELSLNYHGENHIVCRELIIKREPRVRYSVVKIKQNVRYLKNEQVYYYNETEGRNVLKDLYSKCLMLTYKNLILTKKDKMDFICNFDDKYKVLDFAVECCDKALRKLNRKIPPQSIKQLKNRENKILESIASIDNKIDGLKESDNTEEEKLRSDRQLFERALERVCEQIDYSTSDKIQLDKQVQVCINQLRNDILNEKLERVNSIQSHIYYCFSDVMRELGFAEEVSFEKYNVGPRITSLEEMGRWRILLYNISLFLAAQRFCVDEEIESGPLSLLINFRDFSDADRNRILDYIKKCDFQLFCWSGLMDKDDDVFDGFMKYIGEYDQNNFMFLIK